MHEKMLIQSHDVHIWSTELTASPEQEEHLNQDERNRANRFKFLKHRQRYIAARSMLRQILSFYLSCAPQDIHFAYTEHHKPYLSIPNNALQFNLSHSEDRAIYAFTLQHAIGVDIEKVQASYNKSVAQRFFSPQENEALEHLSPKENSIGFYRIWSRKEAIIKAVGKGLVIPIASFSVAVSDVVETISLENDEWSLIPLTIHEDFQAALATNQRVHQIYYWELFDNNPSLRYAQRIEI